jgi:hypothetical protein
LSVSTGRHPDRPPHPRRPGTRRERVRGDHLRPRLQGAVRGGIADVGVGGEAVQVGAVAQPAQHQQYLGCTVAARCQGWAPGRRRIRAIQPVTALRTGAGTSTRARWPRELPGRGVGSLARPPSPREPVLTSPPEPLPALMGHSVIAPEKLVRKPHWSDTARQRRELRRDGDPYRHRPTRTMRRLGPRAGGVSNAGGG